MLNVDLLWIDERTPELGKMDDADEMGRNFRFVAILVEMLLWCGNVFPSFLRRDCSCGGGFIMGG